MQNGGGLLQILRSGVHQHHQWLFAIATRAQIATSRLKQIRTSSQASCYASLKLCPLNHLITYLLTGVKCRATSVAKKVLGQKRCNEDKFTNERCNEKYAKKKDSTTKDATEKDAKKPTKRAPFCSLPYVKKVQ